MKTSRNKLRLHRKRRIAAKVRGTGEIPRLAVFRSLKDFKAQVIDDAKRMTLAAVSVAEIKKKNNVAGAAAAGSALAKKCLDKKIAQVVFDRAGYKYHGKVKAFAEGARKGGLKF